ncbi:hypothetical protein L5G28_16140 [Gordonia sp. HY285]|uniref:hypothetical protein n=1 Tax=Gordonia liuliyuniae TaxID=2911517 RepID=UPI001F36937A|nr:hypothetical protein [Gordonia liuliyuniae]MCF8611677.1 hypothetical protein [Gordonia liuliyuniae]
MTNTFAGLNRQPTTAVSGTLVPRSKTAPVIDSFTFVIDAASTSKRAPYPLKLVGMRLSLL